MLLNICYYWIGFLKSFHSIKCSENVSREQLSCFVKSAVCPYLVTDKFQEVCPPAEMIIVSHKLMVVVTGPNPCLVQGVRGTVYK